MFWFFVYTPIVHTPFPFEHVQAEHKGKRGDSIQIGYMPFDEAYFHPYWLFWSLAMYFGFAYLTFLIIRLEKNYRNHAIKKSVKIASITGIVGFGAIFGISYIAYSISEMLPEPDPYLEAEFEGLDTYKAGQPIKFSVYLDGYGYTMSYLEMSIKDNDGSEIWSLEPYLPWDHNIDKNFSVVRTIPSSDEDQIIIFAPGQYTLEIIFSGHIITKDFVIEI